MRWWKRLRCTEINFCQLLLPRWTKHLWQTWINHTPVANMDGSTRHLRSIAHQPVQYCGKHQPSIEANVEQIACKIKQQFICKSLLAKIMCKNSKKSRKFRINWLCLFAITSDKSHQNVIWAQFYSSKQSKRSKNNPFHEIYSSSLWGYHVRENHCVILSAFFLS